MITTIPKSSATAVIGKLKRWSSLVDRNPRLLAKNSWDLFDALKAVKVPAKDREKVLKELKILYLCVVPADWAGLDKGSKACIGAIQLLITQLGKAK